jgi:hypothetical protein
MALEGTCGMLAPAKRRTTPPISLPAYSICRSYKLQKTIELHHCTDYQGSLYAIFPIFAYKITPIPLNRNAVVTEINAAI